MKSLQDYIDTFRSIATNLNIRGDSVEVLIQLLANASYISEVENITYSQEASLERASLMNSKIQHCVDNMYSVFRGLCPRVILNIKPLKPMSFNLFDEVVIGNTFKLYYIGWYNERKCSIGDKLSYDDGIDSAPLSIMPGSNEENTETYKIVCILAREVVNKSWTLKEDNTYYVDCINEDLSNDISVEVTEKAGVSKEKKSVTTDFSEHILNGAVFDLTLPTFGSRLYLPGTREGKDTNYGPNTVIEAKYVKYTTLSSYNESDLKKINLKGAKLIKPELEDNKFWSSRGLNEFIPGVYLVKESSRDSLVSTHYIANRSRYTNTIIRSNSDLGDLLERTYPDNIYPGGTKSTYTNDELLLYYIPKDSNIFITDEEKDKFSESRRAYYIADDIKIHEGDEYTAIFDIEVELYQSDSVSDNIDSILRTYERRFDINFLDSPDETSIYNMSSYGEIETLISKIPNVKKIRSLNVSYSKDGVLIEKFSNMTGELEPTFSEEYQIMLNNLKNGSAYYTIKHQIKSII